MNKETIIVPSGVRFISEWENFKLFEFPYILDKKIPGCGFTEYCLTSPDDLILCSPRKILLENKNEQHLGEVFYFKNEFEISLRVDKDLQTHCIRNSRCHGSPLSSILTAEKIRKIEEEKREEERKRIEHLELLKSKLITYILDCRLKGRAAKIIVTYDSFKLIKGILQELGHMSNFHVIIDEFQSIFTDSRFKSDTELEFLGQLQDLQKVCYVSATPMIESYLDALKEFKDLPYYELDWEFDCPGRVLKPDLQVRVIKSVTSEALRIIQEYKSGVFAKAVEYDDSGNLIEIESREAVFYVNSVKNIVTIINKAELKPEEVNILCADTLENKKKLRKDLGKNYEIGTVPLRNKPHKMFTFCTRTVYLGADFYSKCARTFILSDANIETLSVDITLDLPQILGRQRLTDNPWKNRAELYFKTLKTSKSLTKEDFESLIQKKLKSSQNILKGFDLLQNNPDPEPCQEYKEMLDLQVNVLNYQKDYVCLNKHGGKNSYPVLNQLVMISEKRAFDVQQIDYKDRFTVFNKLACNGLSHDLGLILATFNSYSDFYSKMKFLCELDLMEEVKLLILDQSPIMYKNYYLGLGPDKLKSIGYSITKANKVMGDKNRLKLEVVKSKILSTFEIGKRYSLYDIKSTLREIYCDSDYSKTPKAIDLAEFFEIKAVLIKDKETGKLVNGYKILSLKSLPPTD